MLNIGADNRSTPTFIQQGHIILNISDCKYFYIVKKNLFQINDVLLNFLLIKTKIK